MSIDQSVLDKFEKWEDFKNDPETYIDNAFNKRKSEISKKTKVRP